MSDADDVLAAAAEAEAAEAEALAVAARARAQAIRLRHKAAALESAPVDDSGRDLPPEQEAAEQTTADQVAAEQTTTADESAATVTDTSSPAPRRRLLLKVAAAAVVVVASFALLGLSVAMFVYHQGREAQRQASAEFAAGARQGVVTLMSLDFNKAQEDAQRIVDSTTGDFKKDFERQAKEFVQVARDSKVVTEANVNAVAVQSMTKDTATVLVAVATNVSNKASNQQAPRSWRLSVNVTRDGDQMKLSKVEFVQ